MLTGIGFSAMRKKDRHFLADMAAWEVGEIVAIQRYAMVHYEKLISAVAAEETKDNSRDSYRSAD